MIRTLKKTISLISSVVPKRNKRVVVYSLWRHGNTEIFYNEVVDSYPNLEIKRFSKNELFGLNHKSLKNLLFFYTARFIVTSHGPCEFKSPTQIHISVFHGVPLKRIGLISPEMVPGKFPSNYINKNIDYHVVSSFLSGALFSSSWNIPERKMLYFGEPILDEITKVINKNKRSKEQILYCPTWRKDDSYIVSFMKHAESRPKILWTVSPHPADFAKCEKIVTQANLKNVTLHKGGSLDIIHEFEHVYIDISSIFYYLIFAGATITIFFPDKDNYLQEFGSLFSKFEIFGFPEGSTTHTIRSEQSETLKKLFFADYSGGASSKIADFISNFYLKS